MARTFVFNSAALDPASALVRSVLQTQPASKPVFVLGDNPEINLYVGDGAGGYDARSGAADVTPWLGIGTPGAAPTGGTFFLAVSSATSGAFTVGKRYWIKNYMAGDYFLDAGASADETGVIFIATAVYPDTWSFGSEVCEITEDIAFNASAATVEAALEATQAVVGVAVTKPGSAPIYSVQWDTVGARSALIGGPALLTPSSAAVVSVIEAGDSSTQARQIVRLTQKPAALQVTWALIDNGWNAILDCNTEGLLELLDGAASVSSKLELQLVDGDGNITTVGQVDCLIRNEAIDEESTVPLDLPAYLTASQTLLQCVQNRYAVTALTGGGTALDGIVTGPSASPSVSTNALAAIELSGVLSFYELVTGTDAESSPDVIRPDDYDGSTNERVWKLRTVVDDTKLPLSGGTLLGQLNFSGTDHAGIKLLSLTTSERDDLTAENGMLIYNSTADKFQQRRDGSWDNVGASEATSTQLYAENPSSYTTPSASGNNSVAIGDGASATGVNAVAIGPSAEATDSSFAFGSDANANGVSAIALGWEAKANLAYSNAIGTGAICKRIGQTVISAAINSASSVSGNGFSIQGVAAKTTNATPTEMLFNYGSYTQRLSLENNSSVMFRVSLIARRTDSDGESDAWEFSGLIHRDANAGTTTLDALQSNQIGSTAWTVGITADTTNGAIKITVTGESSKTIAWIARVEETTFYE